MYEYGGMRHNTEEVYSEDEYMVVALDFVLDLLLVIDIFSTLDSVMVCSQDTQLPCWKTVPNTEVTLKLLMRMEQNLQQVEDHSLTWPLDVELWPNTAPHLEDIFNENKFRQIPLVEGWLVDKTAVTSKRLPVGWKKREYEDVHKDALEFVRGLAEEFRKRITKAVPEGIKLFYKAIDLAEIMRLVTRTWSDALDEAVMYEDEATLQMQQHFVTFFHHVQSLPHLQVGI